MFSKITIKISYLFIFLCFISMTAQEKVFKGDPDTAFETARKLAFNDHRKQAQDSLALILTKYPEYHEIRTFLATTYTWDEDYKRARKEFAYILDKDGKNKEAWIGAIKNELSASLPYDALGMVTEALHLFPNDTDLLYLKASAEEKTDKPLEALNTIDDLLAKDPENQKAKDYKTSLNVVLRKNWVGITTAVDLYSQVFDPMQYYTLEYGRQTKYGSFLAKVNLNRRFNTNGAQYELDLYPRIIDGLYAYLNLGLSQSSIFPSVRYGAELYKSLPKSFEVSLGFRSLKYTDITNIYTGSVGWYYGNSYWAFRPYLTPGDNGLSKSGTLTYRRYRSDADNYLGFAAGIGFSPELNQFYIGQDDPKVVNFRSQKFNVGYFFTTSNKKDAWGAQLGVFHQEIPFDQDNFFWIYNLTLSWELRFK
jgi:YaiO family outer membrane protein